jgi:hypothetical protein
VPVGPNWSCRVEPRPDAIVAEGREGDQTGKQQSGALHVQRRPVCPIRSVMVRRGLDDELVAEHRRPQGHQEVVEQADQVGLGPFESECVER